MGSLNRQVSVLNQITCRCRHNHLVCDIVLPECAQGQRLVIRVVLYQQNEPVAHDLLLSSLEGEVEGRALIDLRLGPDLASVPVNDALRARQTDAGARELGRSVQPLEGSE